MTDMNLKERLAADYKEALKAGDEIKKNTVSFARAAIKQQEIDGKNELDDAGVAAVLAKQVKMRKDALSDFEKAGRTDLLNAYNREIEILTGYMPKQLTAEEIERIVEETAAELGAQIDRRNMGKLMGAVMAKVRGLADGDAVRRVIEERLP
jgi:uncharacterized protein YqeY